MEAFSIKAIREKIKLKAEKNNSHNILKTFKEEGLLTVGSLKTALEFALISGRDCLTEPPFSGLLHMLQLNAWHGLKKRARIRIPESAALIGVADA